MVKIRKNVAVFNMSAPVAYLGQFHCLAIGLREATSLGEGIIFREIALVLP